MSGAGAATSSVRSRLVSLRPPGLESEAARGCAIDPLLKPEERRVVQAQRDLLRDARALLGDLEMLPEDQGALAGIEGTLDELFLLVIVGEYNAGKSTLINALLGERILEVGDLPTTREVHLLKHGDVRATVQA